MSTATQQLEFNFGLLTQEQQSMVDRFITDQKKQADHDGKVNETIVSLLVEASFKEDQFEDTHKVEKITKERSFGYGSNQFTTTVSYLNREGGVFLLYDMFDYNNKLQQGLKSRVHLDGDRLQCTAITEQYRYYKPTTLLTKLNDKNALALFQTQQHIQRTMIINYTAGKYRDLYPNAKVTVGEDYSNTGRRYISFPIVTVLFDSGSFVSFRLGVNLDEERVHKKYDAVSINMNGKEVLDMFNSQPSK